MATRRQAKWQRRILWILPRLCLRMLIAVGWLWALGALLFFPDTSAAWRLGSLAVWIVGSMATVFFVSRRIPRVAILLGGIFLIRAFLGQVTPRSDRAWQSGQERMVTVRYDGDEALIGNIRDWHWSRPAGDAGDFDWIEGRYDLNGLRSADYVLVPLGSWRGIAHVFVSFGFENGEHLAISVESRREQGETFSPLRGLYRNFELIYVVGTERDLIGSRVNVKQNPVCVFPLRATPAALRKLLVSLLDEAVALRSRPAFYDSLTNTCTSNIIVHANAVLSERISRIDWRLVFPGYSDEAGIEKGLFDTGLDIDRARERFLVNDRAAWLDDAKLWSARLRIP